MPTEHERLSTLRQAAAKANSNGYVAILVKDLQWLLDAAEERGPSLHVVRPEQEVTDAE